MSPRESLRDWMSFVGELEEAGAERLWLIDSQLAMKDVYAGLVTAALATSKMVLGTGVTNVATRHPTVTASSIAAVSELSGGRAVLGLGAGDSAVYALGKSPTKLDEMAAALTFFRVVLAGGSGEWEGREFRLSQQLPPVQIFLAVSQRRMCRLAGRLADGAVVMGPAQADLVAQQVRWIEEGLAEAGRQRSEIEVCGVAPVSPTGTSGTSGGADVRAWAVGQARLLAEVADLPEELEAHRSELVLARERYGFGEHLSTRAEHRSLLSEELLAMLAIVGPTQECARRLGELRAAGVDSFIFPLTGRGRVQQLRLLAEEIVPRLTEAPA
ncbi:MAG TPA: LLM class flavin-dependent oxidoreductase [Acidimicrobiales bacterium]|nr:LLM class flavin-dependent oxidoreductase [Acidimicrobiales bacterium]